ncbi:MAG TPA: hypothetical protein DD473_12010 [Planctomycetaceae bacterium]|nr:hypothetical protein [Planctomycetaceae bacterium]
MKCLIASKSYCNHQSNKARNWRGYSIDQELLKQQPNKHLIIHDLLKSDYRLHAFSVRETEHIMKIVKGRTLSEVHHEYHAWRRGDNMNASKPLSR